MRVANTKNSHKPTGENTGESKKSCNGGSRKMETNNFSKKPESTKDQLKENRKKKKGKNEGDKILLNK